MMPPSCPYSGLQCAAVAAMFLGLYGVESSVDEMVGVDASSLNYIYHVSNFFASWAILSESYMTFSTDGSKMIIINIIMLI